MPAPLDVLETLERKLQGDVDNLRRQAQEIMTVMSAKPKGQMRELKKKFNELNVDLSREEGNLAETRKDLEKARARKK